MLLFAVAVQKVLESFENHLLSVCLIDFVPVFLPSLVRNVEDKVMHLVLDHECVVEVGGVIDISYEPGHRLQEKIIFFFGEDLVRILLLQLKVDRRVSCRAYFRMKFIGEYDMVASDLV